MCLMISRYVWLPADINDQTGSFNVDWHDLYTIDVKSGRITYPKGRNYEAEKGELSGLAYITLCVSPGPIYLSRRSAGILIETQPTCSGNKVVTGSKWAITHVRH